MCHATAAVQLGRGWWAWWPVWDRANMQGAGRGENASIRDDAVELGVGVLDVDGGLQPVESVWGSIWEKMRAVVNLVLQLLLRHSSECCR